jgi:hypothetical protein
MKLNGFFDNTNKIPGIMKAEIYQLKNVRYPLNIYMMKILEFMSVPVRYSKRV